MVVNVGQINPEIAAGDLWSLAEGGERSKGLGPLKLRTWQPNTRQPNNRVRLTFWLPYRVKGVMVGRGIFFICRIPSDNYRHGMADAYLKAMSMLQMRVFLFFRFNLEIGSC